ASLVGFFAVLGVAAFLLIAGLVSMFKHFEPVPATLPAQMVLELDLSEGVAEFQGAQTFGDSAPDLRTVIQALDRGRKDSAVKGLVVDFSSSEGLGFAQT